MRKYEEFFEDKKCVLIICDGLSKQLCTRGRRYQSEQCLGYMRMGNCIGILTVYSCRVPLSSSELDENEHATILMLSVAVHSSAQICYDPQTLIASGVLTLENLKPYSVKISS